MTATTQVGNPVLLARALSRVGAVWLHVLLFGVLVYLYADFVRPLFGYTGFVWRLDDLKIAEAIVLATGLAACLPPRVVRPSDAFALILFYLPIAPMLVLYGLAGHDRVYMYSVVGAYTLLLFIRTRVRLPQFVRPQGGRYVVGVSILLVALTLAVVLARGGWRYFNLDPMRVYEYRDAVNRLILSGWFGYLFAWATKVFNPLAIVLLLSQRRWVLPAALFGIQVLLFALTSHKALVVYPLIAVAVYVAGSWTSRWLVWIFLALLAAYGAAVFARFGGDVLPASMLVRRGLFLPAELNFVYHDYFAQAGHTWLANVKPFRYVLEYPFAAPPPRLISDYLYGHQQSWVNAGFWATGFMHLGYLGVMLFATIVGVLLGLLDQLCRERIAVAVGAAVAAPAFLTLFVSADLFVSLLTHGGLVVLLALYFCGDQRHDYAAKAV